MKNKILAVSLISILSMPINSIAGNIVSDKLNSEYDSQRRPGLGQDSSRIQAVEGFVGEIPKTDGRIYRGKENTNGSSEYFAASPRRIETRFSRPHHRA